MLALFGVCFLCSFHYRDESHERSAGRCLLSFALRLDHSLGLLGTVFDAHSVFLAISPPRTAPTWNLQHPTWSSWDRANTCNWAPTTAYDNPAGDVQATQVVGQAIHAINLQMVVSLNKGTPI